MTDLLWALILLFGLPLALIAVGFFIIAVKIFRGGGLEEKRRLAETARRLDQSLSGLESRLGALEDIILTGERRAGS